MCMFSETVPDLTLCEDDTAMWAGFRGVGSVSLSLVSWAHIVRPACLPHVIDWLFGAERQRTTGQLKRPTVQPLALTLF